MPHCAELVGHFLCGRDQILYQPLIHFQQAFVLPEVAFVVAQVQHTPDLRSQPQCVRQHLKDDVAVGGAVALGAQRGQAQGVGSVVG